MSAYLNGPSTGHSSLPTPTIAVSFVCLDLTEDACGRFAATLSPSERRRADGFHMSIDRRRYLARHGLLREFLACHFDCNPADIPLVCGHFQRPYVDGRTAWLSLSHARDKALFAFSRDVEIGCDVAFEDSTAATGDVAELFLAPCELRSLQSHCALGKVAAFFHYWTAKEAYLKARGTGLSRPMQGVVVSDDGPPRYLALEDDDPAEWSLMRLNLPAGYCGALAAHCATAVICPPNTDGAPRGLL